jgi:hypothetical protein
MKPAREKEQAEKKEKGGTVGDLESLYHSSTLLASGFYSAESYIDINILTFIVDASVTSCCERWRVCECLEYTHPKKPLSHRQGIKLPNFFTTRTTIPSRTCTTENNTTKDAPSSPSFKFQGFH